MRELIINDLLPMARRGLESANIPAAEIDEYLDVIAVPGGLWPERRCLAASVGSSAWQRSASARL